MIILITWLLINFAALCCLIKMLYSEEEIWEAFVYPKISRWLRKEEVGEFGTIFIDILLTLFFLPAAVAYLVFILTMMILGLAVYFIIYQLPKKWK